MRAAAKGLAFLALATPARAAHARGSAHVTYSYPADDAACPDEATWHGMITSQLGYDPFEASSSTRVAASIERTRGRLRGRIALSRDGAQAGEKLLEASNDCASVAKALALTVAVAIDTLDAPEPTSKPGELGPDRTEDAGVRPAAPPEPTASRDAPPRELHGL